MYTFDFNVAISPVDTTFRVWPVKARGLKKGMSSAGVDCVPVLAAFFFGALSLHEGD
jgi:hypothetical protein